MDACLQVYARLVLSAGVLPVPFAEMPYEDPDEHDQVTDKYNEYHDRTHAYYDIFDGVKTAF